MKIEIWHNPRCKKSRETLQILEDAGADIHIRKYLEEPPSKRTLANVLQKLDMTAEDLLRKNEKIFKQDYKGKDLSDDEWLDVMVNTPKLIERPVVIKGERAVIGRPPENVKELIE